MMNGSYKKGKDGVYYQLVYLECTSCNHTLMYSLEDMIEEEKHMIVGCKKCGNKLDSRNSITDRRPVSVTRF